VMGQTEGVILRMEDVARTLAAQRGRGTLTPALSPREREGEAEGEAEAESGFVSEQGTREN